MKRFTKVVGFVGGVVAVTWAMRDRFISVAASREPEPPSFRTPPSRPPMTGTPVNAIDGVGPVFAGRLSAGGIHDAAALAATSPDLIAETAGVSVARARTWIDKAKDLI
jgi:predicted flap endonuclease-1-like 5' DNA nuclease